MCFPARGKYSRCSAGDKTEDGDLEMAKESASSGWERDAAPAHHSSLEEALNAPDTEMAAALGKLKFKFLPFRTPPTKRCPK